MNRLYKLSYKYSKYSISNLMLIIVCGTAFVFLADRMLGWGLSSMISLNMAMVARGQVWRLLTFIFVPYSSSPISAALMLYFYYFVGSSLEREWGSFIFNIYYLAGMLGAIVAALISGFGTVYYLNMSLFFAFAILYPDLQVMFMFLIPIKVKYLALLDAMFFVYSALTGGFTALLAIGMSLLNVALFFGGDLIKLIKREAGYYKTRKNFRNQNNRWNRMG